MITRDALLYLAKQDQARGLIMGFGPSRKAALRFVAGEDVGAALRAVRDLNQSGVVATIDVLGEDVKSQYDVLQATDNYVSLIESIAREQVESHVSLKLTQLGLTVGIPFCQECVSRVIDAAAKHDNFVRIDMEDSSLTEQTLDVYRRLREVFDNVGIVMQSCLYRSSDDLERLVNEGIANVRLCKGAYRELSSVAYPRKIDVDRNYLALISKMLNPTILADRGRLAIATHDNRIINLAKQYAQVHNVPRDSFEFQMLYDIKHNLQQKLTKEGYRVRVYVPFGQQWYRYFMRRLAERPANILFIIRAITDELGK